MTVSEMKEILNSYNDGARLSFWSSTTNLRGWSDTGEVEYYHKNYPDGEVIIELN